MGAALSYYLAVELLTNDGVLPPGMRIKVVTFGSPRVGDQAFASFWKNLVEEYRSNHGQESFLEYNVRAYNDGEPHTVRAACKPHETTSDSLQGSPCCRQ